MKNKVFISMIIGVACITQPTVADSSNRAKDHEGLIALRNAIVKGLNRQDIKLLKPHLTKEFVYTGIDQTVITNVPGLSDYFEEVFRSPDASVDKMTVEAVADCPTRFIAENIGVCYGTAKEVYKLKNGTEVALNSRWTATCIKEEGKWKVSAVQTGVNVLDNTVLKKSVRFWKNCTGTGVAVGLVLGTIISAVMRKRANS